MAAAPDDCSYRIASNDDDDHACVVALLRELVDELSPSDGAERIKRELDVDIRLALANRNVRVFLAEVDGEAVGLSRADILLGDPIFRLREDHRCGYVDQMYVREGFRDHGVGQALLQLCEDWFRAEGLQHALLHAAPKAARFYARIGYQPNREMYKRL